MNTTQTDKYTNAANIPIRTRIALLLILIAIKLCEPWEYAHQFSDDMDALRATLLGRDVKK